ncbi:hypothetical protein CONLIGDRAFT_685792 [Coniochaeta ligniaria NRRL 30616]|uniref:Uncharacterized protein n=1 Tax=Coniochaeta ligniaria NRRL 30616 TaxID=1408157 RepID=A0A1J7J2X0_9PEZI|nr:hypothetical protein CONLIGDRAFT_685792 [Coniochaeta ligniaria NRRL 30616]
MEMENHLGQILWHSVAILRKAGFTRREVMRAVKDDVDFVFGPDGEDVKDEDDDQDAVDGAMGTLNLGGEASKTQNLVGEANKTEKLDGDASKTENLCGDASQMEVAAEDDFVGGVSMVGREMDESVYDE